VNDNTHDFLEYAISLLEIERKKWDENHCMRKFSSAAKA
jgi:hypothetical protein